MKESTAALRKTRGKRLGRRAKKKISSKLRSRKLRKLRRKAGNMRKLRVKSVKLLVAALAATAHKGRRPAVGNLSGAGLKKRRSEKKRFFRAQVKRNVKRRRRR
jgi:hypothetical protein